MVGEKVKIGVPPKEDGGALAVSQFTLNMLEYVLTFTTSQFNLHSAFKFLLRLNFILLSKVK